MKERVLVELDLTNVSTDKRKLAMDALKRMGFSDHPTRTPPRNPDLLARLNPISTDGVFTFQRIEEVEIEDEDGKMWHTVQGVLNNLGIDTTIYIENEIV